MRVALCKIGAVVLTRGDLIAAEQRKPPRGLPPSHRYPALPRRGRGGEHCSRHQGSAQVWRQALTSPAAHLYARRAARQSPRRHAEARGSAVRSAERTASRRRRGRAVFANDREQHRDRSGAEGAPERSDVLRRIPDAGSNVPFPLRRTIDLWSSYILD